MKHLNLFIAFILLIGFMLSPIVAVAQYNNVLPEKNSSTLESSNGTSGGLLKKDKNKEDAKTWAFVVIAIMMLALGLLFAEVAIIPGFGVAGISGIVLLVAAIVISFLKLTKGLFIAVVIFSVISVVLLICFAIFVLPNTKMAKRFILESSSAPLDETENKSNDLSKYLGLEGIAISNLRPSGFVKVLDERVDVVSDGSFIDKGTKVKFVKNNSDNIVVKPIE